MANEILQKVGTPIVWADETDFVSTVSGYTRTTNAQLNLESVAANAARQGVKMDLGATFAAQYSVYLGIEGGTAPTAGLQYEVFLSWSASATAGTGNAGGASGADGAYKAGEEDEWKKQLDSAGPLTVTNDGAGTTQIQLVGVVTPQQRYVSPVVVNKSGQTTDTDAINHFVALVPIKDEIQ